MKIPERSIIIDGVNQIQINDDWYTEDDIISRLNIIDCQAVRELTDQYVVYDNGLNNITVYFDNSFEIIKREVK